MIAGLGQAQGGIPSNNRDMSASFFREEKQVKDEPTYHRTLELIKMRGPRSKEELLLEYAFETGRARLPHFEERPDDLKPPSAPPDPRFGDEWEARMLDLREAAEIPPEKIK